MATLYFLSLLLLSHPLHLVFQYEYPNAVHPTVPENVALQLNFGEQQNDKRLSSKV